MKTANVTEVRGVRPWTGKNGTIFYHDIVLDNGDRGSVGKKREGAIRVGDSLTYTIDADRITVVNPSTGGAGRFGSSKPAASPSSMALAYAKDLAVAFIAKSDTPAEKMEAVADRVISIATKFDKWIKENS